jgi:predicted DNA-binding helix-hairpin-helix protein
MKASIAEAGDAAKGSSRRRASHQPASRTQMIVGRPTLRTMPTSFDGRAALRRVGLRRVYYSAFRPNSRTPAPLLPLQRLR